jgi:putative nucleotidyltransferase with HDIG domain
MEAVVRMRVFRGGAYAEAMESLRRHSVATARIAALLSRITSVGSELAGLAGLLHDVGFCGSLLALGDVRSAADRPDLALAWPVLEATHEEIGKVMVRLWRFPAEMVHVVGEHHHYTFGKPPPPLHAIVAVAETVAADLGFGLDPFDAPPEAGLPGVESPAPDGQSPVHVAQSRAALGLDEALTAKLLQHAREAVRGI